MKDSCRSTQKLGLEASWVNGGFVRWVGLGAISRERLVSDCGFGCRVSNVGNAALPANGGEVERADFSALRSIGHNGLKAVIRLFYSDGRFIPLSSHSRPEIRCFGFE